MKTRFNLENENYRNHYEALRDELGKTIIDKQFRAIFCHPGVKILQRVTEWSNKDIVRQLIRDLIDKNQTTQTETKKLRSKLKRLEALKVIDPPSRKPSIYQESFCSRENRRIAHYLKTGEHDPNLETEFSLKLKEIVKDRMEKKKARAEREAAALKASTSNQN